MACFMWYIAMCSQSGDHIAATTFMVHCNITVDAAVIAIDAYCDLLCH